MQATDKLDKLLTRVEPVELCYNGLGGSIIKWTMDHGSKKRDGKPQDHPSLLAFIVGRDGKPFALLSAGGQYQAGSLTKWANEKLDEYEKQFPRTRIPFTIGKVDVTGEGTKQEATCDVLDDARKAETPVLVYFGRGYFTPKDKAAKKQNKRARKFEKGPLNSKAAAKYIAGWTLLRFDLADADHVVLATALGVTEAPSLVLFEPGAKTGKVLDYKTSAGLLGMTLKKHWAKPVVAK